MLRGVLRGGDAQRNEFKITPKKKKKGLRGHSRQ